MRGAATAAWSVAVAALCLSPGCRRAKLPPRPDGAAVVVVTGGEPEPPATPEVEPNDHPAKAQSLIMPVGGTLAVIGTLGTLGTAGAGHADADLFRLERPQADAAGSPVPEGGAPDAGARRPTEMLRLEVRPDAALVARLEVLDGSGHPVIAAAAAEPGQPVVIPNLALGAVPIVRIRRARPDDGPGSYRLLLRVGALEPGAEVEPNGAPALANLLVPDGEAIGFLGWARDQDWYRLPTTALAEGSVLAVDVEAPAGVATTVALVNAAGVKLSEARGGRGERAVLRNVGVPVAASELFLSVTAASGWNGDATYAVRIRSELPKAGGETEPNDNPAQAQPVGDGTVQGYLARGDVDVFSYTAAASPVALDVELVPPERAAVKLEVLDAAGKSLGRAEGRRRPVKLSGVPVAAGAVLVRVAAGKGEGNPDEPYKLTIGSRPLPLPGAGDGAAGPE